MNRFSKTGLTLLFILVLFMPSYIHADPPTLNIPPTNAYAHVKTDNGTINANDYDSTVTIQGLGGITVNGSNNQHKIFISGINCSSTTISEQTSNRSFNTVYHNTSGKTKTVIISADFSTPANTDVALILVRIGTTPAFGTFSNDLSFGLPVTSPTAGLTITESITFIVPPGYYYEGEENLVGTGSTFLDAWYEYLNPSCGSGTSAFTGTYNQTLANNVPINTNGNRINFINGTGNPVHVVNSNSGQQVNVTISSAGASGVTQLNGFTGKINLTRTYSNNTEIINDTGNLQISVKPNVVLTNGSKQTFTKSLDLGGPTNNQDIFDDIGIVIRNPLHSKAYTISAGAITQNSTLNLPITDLTSGPSDTLLSNNIFATVSRKNFLDNTVMFRDLTDFTKTLRFELSGMTTGKTITISGHQTTTQTINIPNIVSTDQFTTAVAQNFTSDANAITGLPISNHYCGWYFVTGNSTFRLICNFNGIAHVLGKQ